MTGEDFLRFRLLGEVRVIRGQRRCELPPSRKTRALLAYLLLTEREHRRERLCGMFWDVADDPRGALRWSLSKLRGLIDEPQRRRVAATRDSVRIDLLGAEVDLLALRVALPAAESMQRASLELLERWAGAFSGEALEGLDLPDFHEFQAWLVAEREQTRKLQAAILHTLVARLSDAPERAMPFARACAQVDPLNPEARTRLLSVAMAAGLTKEAEQHYASALRMFEELGTNAESLKTTWQTLRRSAGRSSAASARPPVEQTASTASPASPPAAPVFDSTPTRASVGREAEHRSLHELLWKVVRERRAAAVVVAGEPGIGKTRLLVDLRRSAEQHGATVLWGTAFEAETGRPYGPLIDALRELMEARELTEGGGAGRPRQGSGASVGRGDLAVLFPELAQGAERDGSRDRLFSAASDLVARAASSAPLVIVLDDVQWLDAASAELMHYVMRTSREAPVLLAMSLRSEEASDNAALSRVLRSLRRDRLLRGWTLSPLESSAVRALVEAQGSDVDPDLVVAQCGGNPLFALELSRVGRADGEGGRLPDSVTEAVRERLERLAAEPADVLRWGAVLGNSFRLERLEALMVLDLEALVSALEVLERSCLLVRETSSDGQQDYAFAHELVKRVVYADLSEPRRRLMHRRAASTLRAHDDLSEALVAEIAHHATLGHDHDLAASACTAAGRRCLRLFANTEAMTLARRGLFHAEKLDGLERVKRVVELMEIQLVARRSDEPEADAETLRRLGEQALSQGAVSHARLAFHLRSYLNWEGGEWAAAQHDSLQAMTALRGADEAERVSAMADAARCLVLLERDLGKADALLTEAQARARPLGLETAALFDGRGMLDMHRGDFDSATALFDQASILASAAGDRLLEYYAVEHRTTVELDRGDYAGAMALCPKLRQIGEKLREGSEAPFARTIEALARYGAGEPTQQELGAGLQALRDLDAKYRLVYALTRAAVIDLERGGAERALAFAAEARPLAELLERPSEHLLALSLVARAAGALGRHEDERAALDAIRGREWHGIAASALRVAPSEARVSLGGHVGQTRAVAAARRAAAAEPLHEDLWPS